MIRIDLTDGSVTGEPAELAQFWAEMNKPLSEQDMMDLAGVSERTVYNWKADPRFPQMHKGRVSRLAFIRFLGGHAPQNPAKSRTVPSRA